MSFTLVRMTPEATQHRQAVLPFTQKGIAAFVCAIIAVLSGPAGFVFGIPAVIGGHWARREINQGLTRGSGLVTWALALGYLALVISIFGALEFATA